jgi:geranylgeranyl diphosphate synthase type I
MPESPQLSPLSAVPSEVDAALGAFFRDRHTEFDGIDPVFADGIDALEEFVTGGGKRLRPVFAWAGLRATLESGRVTGDGPGAATASAAQLTTAVASLEFIQACALIHDDIIDHSDTRRGNPTTHRRFAARHRAAGWPGSADDYGESLAILVGDLAFAWADDMLVGSGVGVRALGRAREPWHAMRTEVIAGQMLDIALENTGSDGPADPDAALKVDRYKTAAYTVERPLHLGAALAGADAETVDVLRAAGRDIGLAFQLEDDYLGVFGDPAVTGKAAGDDLRSGKRTFLLACALNAADRDDPVAARRLRAGVGAVTTDAEVDTLRDIILASGAVQQTNDLVNSLTQTALDPLRSAFAGAPVLDELVAVAENLTDRRS